MDVMGVALGRRSLEWVRVGSVAREVVGAKHTGAGC